jgi:DNA repair protein RadC
MGSLWETSPSEQPEQPQCENIGDAESIAPLPDSDAQGSEIHQGRISEPQLLYDQPIQHALWQFTIGGVVQETSTETPSSAHRRIQERVAQEGVHTLSDADLLALLLSTEARDSDIVRRIQTLIADHNLVELLQADIGELEQHVGQAKAAQLKALLEMARRFTVPVPERYTITSPKDAADLVMPYMVHLDHEEMRVLVLNTQNHVVANLLLYQGTLNSSVLRVSEIFRPAVTRKCASIIICHNHPSGKVDPSAEDIEVTKQCVEAGKHLDIALLDHLIIGNHSFLSLKEKLRW